MSTWVVETCRRLLRNIITLTPSRASVELFKHFTGPKTIYKELEYQIPSPIRCLSGCKKRTGTHIIYTPTTYIRCMYAVQITHTNICGTYQSVPFLWTKFMAISPPGARWWYNEHHDLVSGHPDICSFVLITRRHKKVAVLNSWKQLHKLNAHLKSEYTVCSLRPVSCSDKISRWSNIPGYTHKRKHTPLGWKSSNYFSFCIMPSSFKMWYKIYLLPYVFT